MADPANYEPPEIGPDNTENSHRSDTESAIVFGQRSTSESNPQRVFGNSTQELRSTVPVRNDPACEPRQVTRQDKHYSIKHPEYCSVESRMSSFANWPVQIKQTPRELAEASFFYTGSDDCVCCYVCSGRLRQWCANDDPWVEHYRWFPSCPLVCEQSNVDVKAAVFEAGDVAVRYNISRTVEQLEIRADLEELRGAFLEMGFNDSDLKKSLQCVRKTGIIKPTLDDLLEALQGETRSETALESNEQYESLLQENRHLRSFAVCMLCNRRDANILFLPCHHHRTCKDCAQLLTECPVCEENIKEQIVTTMTRRL